MLRLSSIGEVLTRIEHAGEVRVQAYTLHGPVLNALEAAARRGAHVVVELERSPYDDAKGGFAAENARVAGQLRNAGADARLDDPVHAKTISIDGALYLDEKNWRNGDVVVSEDDPAEAQSIPMAKSAALALEAQMLAQANTGDGVIVESESFGFANATYSALRTLALAGASPRLLVCADDLRHNPRERAALERLASDGARVRLCKDSEKLAVAGDRAWLGSANATYADGKWAMPDWGVCTANGDIVCTVRSRLESEWRMAKDVNFAAR
jgi:hypothetical protein